MAISWQRLFESPTPDIHGLALEVFDHWLPRKGGSRLPQVVTPKETVEPEPGYRFIRWHKIYIALTGEGQVQFPGGSIRFRPGQLLIIPPHFPHRTSQITKRGHYAHLFLAPKTSTVYYNVGLREEDPSSARSIRGGEPEIRRSALLLALSNSLTSAEDPALLEGLTTSLIAAFREEFRRTTVPTSSALVYRCRSYVEQELSDPALSVAGIAEELRVHPDHLSRAFHAESGLRLVSYIQASRIRMAQELLAQRKFYPKEVGYLVGFSDPGYFAKVFRKIAGITPSEFQQSALP